VDQRIEEMLQARSGGKPEARMALADFEKMLKGFSAQLSPEQALVWAQKQCYIALGFALAACAELQMDSCPMEGFAPAEFDGILALPKGHQATVALTVGYADPTFKPFPKFRFSPADIVHSDR
jgi:nitroreductase